MADNVTTQNVSLATLPNATPIGTAQCSFSGDTVQIGLAGLVAITGNEGSRTAAIISPATETSLSSVVTNTNTPSTIFNGKTTVTTAGSRVTLASSQAVKSVTIKALAANTGTIYVGNSSVASSNGFALAPGEVVSMDIANLNTVNLDASVDAQGVTYIAVA